MRTVAVSVAIVAWLALMAYLGGVRITRQPKPTLLDQKRKAWGKRA